MLKAKIWINKHNCLFLCLLFLLFLSFIHTCNCPSDTCIHHLTHKVLLVKIHPVSGENLPHIWSWGSRKLSKKHSKHTNHNTGAHRGVWRSRCFPLLIKMWFYCNCNALLVSAGCNAICFITNTYYENDFHIHFIYLK